MSVHSLLMAAAGAADKLYVDDVFSTYLYTGNGSTQTINNGIDLAGNGGLVWIKDRNNINGARNHQLNTFASTNFLASSSTTDASSAVGISANSSGFSQLGGYFGLNEPALAYASWTFRKAAKFFDVVTFTTSATTNTNQRISHALGTTPGMIILKATGAVSNWPVWHRSLTDQTNYYLLLNGTDAQANYGNCFSTSAPTSTDFGINTNFLSTNQAMVAYVFAHDTAADGIIQCGSFSTDASGNATVELGWEPQYLLMKTSATIDSGWLIEDSMRGLPIGTGDKYLEANNANAEASTNNIEPTATGFKHTNVFVSKTFIYIAIRRPNKTPTSGTQVFSPVTATDTSTSYTSPGFPPDVLIAKAKAASNYGFQWYDRLRGVGSSGGPRLKSHAPDAESSWDGFTELLMNGFKRGGDTEIGGGVVGANITYALRRAPGFMDVVCFKGTGAAHTENHNLTVVPEFILVKKRTGIGDNWVAYHAALGANYYNYFSSDSGSGGPHAGFWNNTTPTSTTFEVGTALTANGESYVAYLFATLPGISKVGSYTGNGSSQTINCGFSAGARFVLIKRTDSTGDWFVWDTVRGIVAANDPHLSLNATAAEVTTDDSIDPDSTGFIVNQDAATNINVNGASYIYLAIA